MDTKPNYPRYLYLVSGFIGGIVGMISLSLVVGYFFYPRGNYASVTTEMELTGIMIWLVIFACILGAGVGAILGVISGRIAYAIKPSKGASLLGAALGSGGSLILASLLLAGFDYQRQVSREKLQREAQQLQESIPSIPASFQELFEMSGVRSCAISNDGSRLAVAGLSGTKVWDLDKNVFIGDPLEDNPLEFQGLSEGLALSPDGHTLAAGGYPSLVWWELETGKKRLPTSDYSGMVNTLAYSPDGRLLASASMEGTLILWDAKTGQQVANLGDSGFSPAVAFSPDSKLLAAGGNQIVLWDLTTHKPAGRLAGKGAIKSLAFSPDGSQLAASVLHLDTDNGTVDLWDVAKRSLIGSTQPIDQLVQHANFSPDGRQLVLSGYGNSTLYIWDVKTLQPLGKIADPSIVGNTATAFFLPDGRLLVCYEDLIQSAQFEIEDLNRSAPIGIWTIE
jgi:WD40 repeat protein